MGRPAHRSKLVLPLGMKHKQDLFQLTKPTWRSLQIIPNNESCRGFERIHTHPLRNDGIGSSNDTWRRYTWAIAPG